MFFLGHFTGGLFGGMRDTMPISNDWETLKQKRLETRHIERMAQGAELTADALRQQQRALSVDKGAQQAAIDASALYGRGGEHSPARQSKSYTDADLEEIPAPTWQQKLKTALKSAADRTSPREGKAFGGVTDSSSAIPAIPKPGQQPTYGSKVDNLDPYSPDFDTGVFNKASG